MAIQIAALIVLIYLVTSYNLNVLSRVIFRIFKTQSSVVRGMSFFFLPGTFLHELGHLLFAEFMMVRTDDLNVIPEVKEDNTIKLGGVKIERTDPIRRTIIGIAPTIFGAITIWVVTYLIIAFNLNIYLKALFVYLVFQITHTMFSSRKDLEGLLLGVLLMTGIYFLGRYVDDVVNIALIDTARTKVASFILDNLHYLRTGLLWAVATDISFSLCLYVVKILTKPYRGSQVAHQ